METITKETGDNTIEKVSTPCSNPATIDDNMGVERGMSIPDLTDKLEYKDKVR
jgi:hypothetical protein